MRASSALWMSGLALLFIACGANKASAPAKNPEAEQHLKRALLEHQALAKKLAQASQQDRATCEFQAGDCAVLVNERRDKLISSEGLSCSGDVERATQCVADELVRRGKHEDVASYYAFDSWCIQKILACTGELERRAARAQRDQRFEARRREIETSAEGLRGWNSAEFARQKVKYLRTTLPPSAGDACQSIAEVEACTKQAAAEQKQFEAELHRDDFDRKRALAAYEKMKKTEASCPAPEFACLAHTIQAYGAVPENKKWLERNLAMLERRQQLSTRASAEVQVECLNDREAEHQEKVVAAYSIYSRQPVLFFRTQLEKAFLAMHESQVHCLTGKEKIAAH